MATRRVLEEEKALLTLDERDRLVREIQDEVLGLGPAGAAAPGPDGGSDILVNGHKDVYIERARQASSARPWCASRTTRT